MRYMTRAWLPLLLLTALAAIIPAAGMAVVPVNGTTPILSPVTINASTGDQTDPHVSGDWAAYTDNVSIRYYNFANSADAQIPMGTSARDTLSDVSGGKVVFSRTIIGVKTAVMVFDAVTAAAPIEIDAAPATTRLGSSIGGNTVAYVDLGLHANGELVVHDLATSTSQRLTNDAAFDSNPSVSANGSTVTWEHCATSMGNCDIWQAVRTGSTWIVSVVMDSLNPEGNPDTNGTLVTYDSQRAGNSDIFWRPVAGGAEVQLELSGLERNPSFAGNFIAFESQASALSATDLFVYNTADIRLYQLTSTPLINEQLNDITILADGRVRVVWASDEDGFDQRNIKGATFSLAGGGSDTTPPVLTVPAPITVDATGPAGAVVSFAATATDNVTPNPTVACAPAAGSTFAIGTTTVNCTATDAANNSSSAGFTVTVLGASTQIGALIDKTLLYLDQPALEATLRARLQTAIDAVVVNNRPGACSALRLYSFVIAVLPAGTLTPAERAELLADAARIRNVLSC